MDNEPTVEVTVTGLQDTAPVAEPAPEIVVIESNTTIEQTPENNTAWQERIEAQLRDNLAAHQNQTAEMLTALQQYRELMNQVMECQLRMETALLQLLPNPPSPAPNAPEPEIVIAPVTEPAAAEVPTEQPASGKTHKKRRRI